MRYDTLLRQAFLRGSICSSGDLTCQYFKGGEKIDPYRAIGFFGYGFFSSPIIYKTFSYMNKINGLSNLGSNCFSYSYSTLRITKNERKRK